MQLINTESEPSKDEKIYILYDFLYMKFQSKQI